MEFDKQMMSDIEKTLNNPLSDGNYHFPISELDGVRVDVRIKKHKHKDTGEHYYFCVSAKDLHHIWDKQLNGRYELFSSDDLENLPKALGFSLLFFENFKLDLFIGKIITKSRPIAETSAKISRMLRQNPRIKTTFEECCVCKDTDTNTKTSCGHYVCIRCISKLPTNEEHPDHDCDQSDELCIERHCPMCRAPFCRIE
tara:strand:+ start:94 stop:690 length:597 start_codon:yes stop_codon:yes gene_type:complete